MATNGRLSSISEKSIVVDIGGTTTHVGLDESESRPLSSFQTPKNRVEIVESLTREIKKVAETAGRDIGQVVVGCPGLIGFDGGVSAALYWDAAGLSLRELLESELECAVSVQNDANLQARSLIRKKRDAIYAVFGTGVGGAIILNGKLVTGTNGFAGEIGHAFVNSATLCRCGSVGCLDTFASGYWLEHRLGSGWWNSPERAHVQSALREAGEATATALTSTINLFDVHEVFLAGHIVRHDSFRETLAKQLLGRHRNARIEFSYDTWGLAAAGAKQMIESGEKK